MEIWRYICIFTHNRGWGYFIVILGYFVFFLPKHIYTRGQVSVNKRISVLSNYFDVSFEIYYVRLKYIDSVGQVMKLLILRSASICCTFNSGHVSSRAPNINKMGCPLYFHTSRVRLKRKYLFRSRKKRNYYFAFNKRSRALYNTTK